MKKDYITQDEFFELVGKIMETHEQDQIFANKFKQDHDQTIHEIMSSMEVLFHKIHAMEEVIEMMTKYINDNMDKQ